MMELMRNKYPYLYETHLHTFPGSSCAKVNVRDNLFLYRELGYDGVFITNHFLDAPGFNFSKDMPYADQIECYFRDYEEAVAIGKELGLKIFCGMESNYDGADFLIYGLNKEWYLQHPEIMEMKRSEELAFLQKQGALVIHAHPFREAWTDHIHLFPRVVHGVEIINGGMSDAQNDMAKLYAEHYGLLAFAGSDNHSGDKHRVFAGMCSETPVMNETEFVERLKSGMMQTFTFQRKRR